MSNEKIVQFNMRVGLTLKQAFIETKPDGISMQRWLEACLQNWIDMPVKKRLKHFDKLIIRKDRE